MHVLVLISGTGCGCKSVITGRGLRDLVLVVAEGGLAGDLLASAAKIIVVDRERPEEGMLRILAKYPPSLVISCDEEGKFAPLLNIVRRACVEVIDACA
ncbi:MAG: hypothetical protein ABWK00_00615 [Desulfurococcaceae archaeon]